MVLLQEGSEVRLKAAKKVMKDVNGDSIHLREDWDGVITKSIDEKLWTVKFFSGSPGGTIVNLTSGQL